MSLCGDNANEQTKRHSDLNDDHTIPDLQEDGGRSGPDLFLTQSSSKDNLDSASDVKEQFSSLPKCVDISFIGKHDNDDNGIDAIPCYMNNMETHKREKQIKRKIRKRRKFSDCPESDTEFKEDANGTSSLIEHRIAKTNSCHSNEATPSCCLENILEREVAGGHGGLSNVVDDILVREKWNGCSDPGQSHVKSMNNIEVENLKETTGESSFSKDVTSVNLQRNNSEQFKCESSNLCLNEVNDAYHTEENLNESVRVDEGTATDISSLGSSNEFLKRKRDFKKEDLILSSSPIFPMNGDVMHVASEDISSQVLYSSLERRGPIGYSRKKLVVLDVNGLLADIVSYVPEWYRPDTFISGKGVFKRPFCRDFLQFCLERFDVGVWSSRYKRNVELIVDFIMGKAKEKLLFCWDQSHCTDTGFNTVENRYKPLLLKELRKLWEKHDPSLPWERGDYDESNTLLLDDSPYKALQNPPHTAVFPYPYRYKDERKDNSLGPGGDIRVYLEGIASAEDVKKYLKENPFGQRPITENNLSWRFYLKVINATSSKVEDDIGSCSSCQQ